MSAGHTGTHNRGITGQGLRPLLVLARVRLNVFSTGWSTRNKKKNFGSILKTEDGSQVSTIQRFMTGQRAQAEDGG